MRRVLTIVEAVCDWCNEKVADESDLNTRTFTYEGVTYDIDMCPVDDRHYQEYAIGLLAERGRKAVPAAKKKKGTGKSLTTAERAANQALYAKVFNKRTKKYECPEEGCDFARPTYAGLSVHTSRAHNKKIGEYDL